MWRRGSMDKKSNTFDGKITDVSKKTEAKKNKNDFFFKKKKKLRYSEPLSTHTRQC